MNNIAGVIPALAINGLRRNQFAGVIRQQITLHDIGAFDMQLSGIINTRDGFQFVFHKRHKTTHSTRFIIYRCVNGYYR